MKTLFKKSLALLILLVVFSCSKDSPTATVPSPTCPQGYTGANCTTQITPTKITISKIEIVSYPLIDPTALSGHWDYPSPYEPDLAIVLSDFSGGTIIDNQSTNYFTNALSTVTHSYSYSTPLVLTNVNHLFKLELRDIDTTDGATYEIMNTYVFSIYSSTGGFPSVIPINNGETKYNIYVSYTW